MLEPRTDTDIDAVGEGVADIYNAFMVGLRPEPIHLTVSEWADKYRILSTRASSEPGKWTTDRTPYLKEPMDALSPQNTCESVVLLFGSQLGKTEVGINWLGSIIDIAPGPSLMVQPTDQAAIKIVRQRINPAISECPVLAAKVAAFKTRDGGNSRVMKEFPGGILFITSSGSAANLASMPIRYLFLDEVDRYPGKVGGEGDPVNLARARTRTFGNAKELITSTPTEAGASRIADEYENTDKRQFYVPCPKCGKKQTLRFTNLVWEKSDNGGRTIHHPETAAYKCEHCEELFSERHKAAMLAEGIWVPSRPEIKRRRGYHLNSLYSPVGWYTWTNIARDFISAKKKNNRQQLKTFVNTVLAETWQEPGDVPDWEVLYRQREEYAFGVCPKGVLLITAGVDIQRDRIEVELVGWGRDRRTWSIDYHSIPGDTASDEPWHTLWALLSKTWAVDGSEVSLPLSMMAVDSGDQTQMVYTRVRDIADWRVMAIRGVHKQVVPVGQPRAMDIDFGGRRVARGVQMWPVGSSIIKTELYGNLRLKPPLEKDKPMPPGYCSFPQYPTEYFRQLTAEQRIRRIVNGQGVFRWEKVYERNEALDCRVYARAAVFVVGIDRFSEDQWKQLEERLKKSTAKPKSVKKTSMINPFTGKEKGVL